MNQSSYNQKKSKHSSLLFIFDGDASSRGSYDCLIVANRMMFMNFFFEKNDVYELKSTLDSYIKIFAARLASFSFYFPFLSKMMSLCEFN